MHTHVHVHTHLHRKRMRGKDLYTYCDMNSHKLIVYFKILTIEPGLYNSSTLEAETEESQVRGQPGLHREFEASLSCTGNFISTHLHMLTCKKKFTIFNCAYNNSYRLCAYQNRKT